jgi:rhodanese-related sulfurtransferase
VTNSITAEALYAQLGLPHSALIVDVRKTAGFDEIPRLLPDARRGVPDDIANWAGQLPKSRPVVAYCLHGHEVGQGAPTTLGALGFDLHDPAVDAVARIARAADTNELQSSPQAAGLLAISLGLGTNFTDDAALLEAAMPFYDALYAWCKTAKHETHNWPFAPKS